MKKILIFLSFFLLAVHPKTSISGESQNHKPKEDFRLHFVKVGFGSNMFEMQPVFKVEGSKFIYTSEIVWSNLGETETEKDTLLTGNFRISSCDSISTLISELKDSIIYKTNIRIMSGALTSISIENKSKKVIFSLHNAYDTTANKIVEILNTYIPENMAKLYLSFGSKTIL